MWFVQNVPGLSHILHLSYIFDFFKDLACTENNTEIWISFFLFYKKS